MLTSVSGQPQPAKPPALPPINPALAHLDQTVGGLDGPGLAVAVKESGDLLAAAGERGTIQFWGKDVSMGIRAADGTPNVLQGHDGPVTALAWNGGPVLASAGADRKIVLWDVAGEKALHTLTSAGGGPGPGDVARRQDAGQRRRRRRRCSSGTWRRRRRARS